VAKDSLNAFSEGNAFVVGFENPFVLVAKQVNRRADELRKQHCAFVAPGRHLHRPHPPFSDKRWSTGLDAEHDPWQRFQQTLQQGTFATKALASDDHPTLPVGRGSPSALSSR
jgi:hypothetical protein